LIKDRSPDVHGRGIDRCTGLGRSYRDMGRCGIKGDKPKDLYKRAWRLADEQEKRTSWLNKGERALTDTVLLAGRASMKP